MSEYTFHRVNKVLSNEETVFICRALKSGQLKLLCLRECKVRGNDLERILNLVGSCHSLHQLTLNIGMVTSMRHVELLAHCIKKNKSLTGLHIHGSDLGDVGMQILGRALSVHPGIVSLDVGDCKLSDMSIDVLYSLMLPVGNRPGITELTLSDNPRISALGWAQFGMCLANCNSLRWLFLDYNPLGDYGASCVLVALSASQSLEVLDLEGCGLTEHTGQVILHLVQNHLGSLNKVKLSNNRIRRSTIEAIKKHISENHLDDIESASTVTIDDLFSCNSTKLPSSFKSSKHHRSSSSQTSSSSSKSSSSSDSDKSSGDEDVAGAADTHKQKQHKNSKKNMDKKEKTEEDTDKRQKEDQEEIIDKYIKKDKDKNSEDVNKKIQDKSKDKQKRDKIKDTGMEEKRDSKTKKKTEEVTEENRDRKKNKKDKDKSKNNSGTKDKTKAKDTPKDLGSSEDKIKDKSKAKDLGGSEDKMKDTSKSKDKTESKNNKKDKYKKKMSKSYSDKLDKKEDSQQKESKEKKNKKIASDDESESDDMTDDEDSLGDELEEVPVFYK